jgi:hypothetical protein
VLQGSGILREVSQENALTISIVPMGFPLEGAIGFEPF